MFKSKYLEIEDVLQLIEKALNKKKPFSLVRIGDGENLVMSQNTVMNIQDVLRQPWAYNGQNGVKLPNESLRDLMIEPIRKASVIGVLPYNDTTIDAPSHLKRDLTDKIFSYYKIKPKYTCHACLNRQLVSEPEFWKILKGKRILIVYQFADQLKNILESKPYNLNISMTIPFSHFNQMTDTLEKIEANKDEFDIALISCSVTAVILAHKIAELTGKVGLDFGKASEMLISSRNK